MELYKTKIRNNDTINKLESIEEIVLNGKVIKNLDELKNNLSIKEVQ